MSEPRPSVDAQEFERVVLPHLDAGYGLARYLLRNADDAEDVVQESVLRALRYFHTLRDPVGARAWFLAILRRECLRALDRSRGPAQSIGLSDVEDTQLADTRATPAESVVSADAQRRMSDAINALSLPLRETLVLRAVHDCSYEEIAQITEVPLGTVMSRLSRARARLVHLLGDHLDIGSGA